LFAFVAILACKVATSAASLAICSFKLLDTELILDVNVDTSFSAFVI